MSGPEKIEAAEKTKKAGNDLYKIGKFKRASKKYEKVFQMGVTRNELVIVE